MNSISRNKYIDKSATPLKAYFTLASARERAQTTYARRRLCACARTRAHAHIRSCTHTQTSEQTSRRAREKEEDEREESARWEGERKSGCTYRRVVCSVYKESCLFLADGYRRKTICLGDLECFVSPLLPIPPDLVPFPFPVHFSSLPFLPPDLSSPYRKLLSRAE